jgi:small subunit ribosomal protein S9
MPETKDRYIEGVGRRKTSVARVRITPASKFSATVNDRSFEDYFALAEYKKSILDALADVGDKFTITAKITGGGASSQADAMRHGLARAIVEMDPGERSKLKVKGYLKRDPRAKERRKFGLKKARKAPQWSKR